MTNDIAINPNLTAVHNVYHHQSFLNNSIATVKMTNGVRINGQGGDETSPRKMSRLYHNYLKNKHSKFQSDIDTYLGATNNS